MANTNKTKAEILQELESIKGLLLEEDDIPILQDTEVIADEYKEPVMPSPASPYTTHESVLPGQGSLFEESAQSSGIQKTSAQVPASYGAGTDAENRKQGFPSHLVTQNHQQQTHQTQNHQATTRSLAKATGENPFLPQHIRERLHGNNPPPLFEYETAKKIISATKNVAQKINRPRQYLVDDVIKSMMPQIESELRHRLFAMSVEDLEKLLNEDED